MSLEAEQRAAVVAEAKSWLLTPYHHGGRLKGIGVDCAGMPLEVYAAAGIIPPTDVGAYSTQWHLHRSQEVYVDWVQRFAREIPVEQASAGDFLVFRYGRTFSHGGVVVAAEPLTIIHAFINARMVTTDEVFVHQDLAGRLKRAFSPWGQ